MDGHDRQAPHLHRELSPLRSTLLRLILDAHPRLAVPPPAWLFHYIYPYLYSYGDLSVEANLRAMVEDALETPTIKEWPLQAGVEEVIAEMKEPTYTELFSALHRLYARPRGKERWGEKSPRDAFYMAEIKSAYPDAQFIHILRDGRDVAIDLSDSILWPNTLYASALMWKDFVQAIEDSAKQLDSDSYHVVRYAELCAQPEAVLRRICEFLGEEFRDEIIAHMRPNPRRSGRGRPFTPRSRGPSTRTLSICTIPGLARMTGAFWRGSSERRSGNSIFPWREARPICRPLRRVLRSTIRLSLLTCPLGVPRRNFGSQGILKEAEIFGEKL